MDKICKEPNRADEELSVKRKAGVPRLLFSLLMRWGSLFWRNLTSMRTALALLFLLACAAIPGAVFPQRQLNTQLVDQYISSHGTIGIILDKLGFFAVFTSFWFTAIYLLLFVSLIGCIVPRTVQHFAAWRRGPVPTPKNLSRLPQHSSVTIETSLDSVHHIINKKLRRWRVREERTEDGFSISAERGYSRELMNLVFHFSLVILLVAVAAGKMYGYEGIRLVIANGRDGLCTSSPSSFDTFRAGSFIDGTKLNPLCLRFSGFQARYQTNGQPESFLAPVDYQSGEDIEKDIWRHYKIRVNHPLRVSGDRVYLLGHGYAPIVTVYFPDGQSRTQTTAFQPIEPVNFLSQGAFRFDPPSGLYSNFREDRLHEISLDGLFAPTGYVQNKIVTSLFPGPINPLLSIRMYIGDDGLDSGTPQNVYTLDSELIKSHQLKKIGAATLFQHQKIRLPQGYAVRFEGFEQWVAVQVSHNPTQLWALFGALGILIGLVGSLVIPRQRIWLKVKIKSENVISLEIAGLMRTDAAGWNSNLARTSRKIITSLKGYTT